MGLTEQGRRSKLGRQQTSANKGLGGVPGGREEEGLGTDGGEERLGGVGGGKPSVSEIGKTEKPEEKCKATRGTIKKKEHQKGEETTLEEGWSEKRGGGENIQE